MQELSGDVDPTIRVIRRSGRWKNRQECTENRKTALNNREMDGHGKVWLS